ncbi:MAG TPA: YjbE family putative metal transport protein [Burkholderiaceae bacterium]|nr:YjbE family putative metal transport protein [Burkholderiaceae bacterium]
MEFSYSLDVIGPIAQISLIDLLLSGDNAILIAMACQHLPPEVRRKAILLGTAAAVLFRVVLTFAATFALRAPYLKLIGAVLLLLIAIELLASDTSQRKTAPSEDASAGLWKAITVIIVADAVMSLDNVVAVAAAAQDSFLFLFLGLLISVPILVFASLVVARLLDAHPMLIEAGAALLGWIAGKTAVSDPAFAQTLEAQSFGLVALAPLLGAGYVLAQGRMLRAMRAAAGQPRGKAAAASSAHSAAPLAPAAAGPSGAGVTPSWEAAAESTEDRPKKYSSMDLTIMAGVAAPILGLLGTLVYVLWHAIASH